MPTTFLWFLFDWRGRISRSAYRLAILALALFVAIIGHLPEQAPALMLGLTAAQLVVSMALDAKRMHDIGMSAALVVVTSLAGVGFVAFLSVQAPDVLHLLAGRVEEILGAGAVSGPAVTIGVIGLSMGSAVRWPFLSLINSRDSGAVYDFKPGRWTDDPEKPVFRPSDARIDEALQQALIDRQLQDAARALSAVAQTAAPAQKGGRKTFGRRAA